MWEPSGCVCLTAHSFMLTALLYSGYTLHTREETHTHTHTHTHWWRCVCVGIANIWLCLSHDISVFLHVHAAAATGNGLYVEAYSSLARFLLGWAAKYGWVEELCVCGCGWGGVEVEVNCKSPSSLASSRPLPLRPRGRREPSEGQWVPTGPARRLQEEKRGILGKKKKASSCL